MNAFGENFLILFVLILFIFLINGSVKPFIGHIRYGCSNYVQVCTTLLVNKFCVLEQRHLLWRNRKNIFFLFSVPLADNNVVSL